MQRKPNLPRASPPNPVPPLLSPNRGLLSSFPISRRLLSFLLPNPVQRSGKGRRRPVRRQWWRTRRSPRARRQGRRRPVRPQWWRTRRSPRARRQGRRRPVRRQWWRTRRSPRARRRDRWGPRPAREAACGVAAAPVLSAPGLEVFFSPHVFGPLAPSDGAVEGGGWTGQWKEACASPAGGFLHLHAAVGDAEMGDAHVAHAPPPWHVLISVGQQATWKKLCSHSTSAREEKKSTRLEMLSVTVTQPARHGRACKIEEFDWSASHSGLSLWFLLCQCPVSSDCIHQLYTFFLILFCSHNAT
nr:uncharacterized protein LOC127326321 isoform X8 [Lolium perenne]XP_051209158.1 uncharacterized protein LOC127326321 isoform X8 [Lolium perenne]